MKRLRKIVGYALVLLGVVWFFQGIGVLPGSFMTGDPQWAAYGLLAVLGGAVMILGARRK